MFVVAAGGANIDPGMVSQHREWAKSAGTGQDRLSPKLCDGRGGRRVPQVVRQQLAKLDQVSRWAVSFLNAEKVRIPKPGDEAPMTRDPSGWVADHMAAMRRGRVSFDPRKG